MHQDYIEVQPREKLGKNANRRLREQGYIPGIVYGGDRGPVPIAIKERDVWEMLHAETGENTVRLLRLAGTDKQRHVMVKDYQIDPISRKLIHADFMRVDVDQVVEVSVPIEIKGTAYGVKNEGGMLDLIKREVELKAKVLEIPKVIEIDVSDLHLNDAIRVKDLEVENVEFVDNPDTVIVKVEPIKSHEVEVAEEEEEMEPEVISKGKKEEE